MKILLIFILGVLLISVISCTRPYPDLYNYNKNVRSGRLVDSLVRSYNNNPIRFNKFYAGNTVIFYGKVQRIDKNGDIIFRPGYRLRMHSLVCIFNDKEDVLNINPSDTIHIKGQIQEIIQLYRNLYIENCEIIN